MDLGTVTRALDAGVGRSDPADPADEPIIRVDLPGCDEGFLHALRFTSLPDDLIEASLLVGGATIVRFTRDDMRSDNALSEFLECPLPLHAAYYHTKQLAFRFSKFSSEVEEIQEEPVFDATGDYTWFETDDGEHLMGRPGRWQTVAKRKVVGEAAYPGVVVTVQPASVDTTAPTMRIGLWQRGRLLSPHFPVKKRLDAQGDPWFRNELRIASGMGGLAFGR